MAKMTKDDEKMLKLDFMDMPQVCKELQREPTGTITPIDAQREEESRVVDALSKSAVNTLLYIGPRGILHYTCPRLHGKPG